MIERYCDICGVEMIDDGTPNMGRNKAILTVSLTNQISLNIEVVSRNKDHTKADICKYCVFDAILNKDDRP